MNKSRARAGLFDRFGDSHHTLKQRKGKVMKTRVGIFSALAMLLAPLAAQAGQAKVILDVHHAGCVLCGPIVKSTLANVRGVTGVSVSQADGDADVMATVTYDDAQTSPPAMIKATTDRGYPAEISKRTSG